MFSTQKITSWKMSGDKPKMQVRGKATKRKRDIQLYFPAWSNSASNKPKSLEIRYRVTGPIPHSRKKTQKITATYVILYPVKHCGVGLQQWFSNIGLCQNHLES